MSDTTPKLSVEELETLIFQIDLMLMNESVN
jgi:hypothetical protein